MPRGRKLSSDDLQLLLLALIGEQPSHGYELIKALETRSNGFYVPSPGMMYPALACMEDRGHVTIALEGNRKRYALSDEGRAHLEEHRERVDAMLERLGQAAQRMERMRSAMAGEEGEGWTEEFAKARHALKRALHGQAGASQEEQRRIAAILLRAAEEIAGKAE
jgi:DNA-binding PadR family transcriptional regulator